ncbi:MAG: aldo/keto reductase [Anaeromicrobium sp.]|jgi:predicted aldo/keto reductase-like oxidoreductase|uniref:aldo/keto reductase n=1 Tax=Anaeromicrobium sp. TaxID=1929132 RepID=UPI0025D39F87|nr:aldo/keto reductase [Anaeromicrobium sp.]MCT4594829.1 aldo/keto reductase [Anaeromicrobium sp.]
MQYVEYGKTGKKVSVVGFGGMRFDMDRSLEENVDLVRYAYEKGINYFDTAPDYCKGQSEIIFGEAFKKMDRDKFYVSTKGMPTKYDTAQKAIEAVKTSLERLKVDKIDFYHVWCLRKMDHYHLAMKPGGQYEGLLKCKEEGLIDHIVFSSHQPGHEIKEILKEDKFDGVLLGVNILNFPYRWDGVVEAYERGYGTVAMNPLAGGAIPKNEEKLSFLSDGDKSPTESALEFLIGSKEMTITLNGFTTKEQIHMACKIGDSAEIKEAHVESLKNKLGENLNSICTACGYCWDCPMEIPVPSYMQVYNEKQMFKANDEKMEKILKGSNEWGLLVGKKASAKDCIRCGKCEEICTQHLPIIKRLKEIEGWEK